MFRRNLLLPFSGLLNLVQVYAASGSVTVNVQAVCFTETLAQTFLHDVKRETTFFR
jgi:hypothetical protein